MALGDSMSQGYMFTDYNEAASQGHDCGFAGCSERSYIKRFYEDLKKEYDGNVDLIDLSVQGLQPDELYAMLAPDLMPTKITYAAEKHFDWWIGEGANDNFKSFDEMAKLYKDAVKAADVLTFDLGMNYFGTYLIDGAFAGESADDNLDEFVAALKPEALELYNMFASRIRDFLLSNDLGMVETLARTALYGYASFLVYFDKCIDYIYTVNPDVELIVVGMFSALKDLTLTQDDITIDFAGLFKIIADSLNVYITTINENCGKYKFADINDDVICLADELAYYADDLSTDIKWLTAKWLNEGLGSENFNKIIDKYIDTPENATTAHTALGTSFTDMTVRTAYEAETPTNEQQIIINAYDKVLAIFSETMMNTRSFTIDEFMGLIGAPASLGADAARVFLDPENAKEIDYKCLHIQVKFTGTARGFGAHPSPEGMAVKYNAVKKAHSSRFAANGTVLNRVINVVTDFNTGLGGLVSNWIERILFNQRSFLAKLTDFIRGIFTVIDRLQISL